MFECLNVLLQTKYTFFCDKDSKVLQTTQHLTQIFIIISRLPSTIFFTSQYTYTVFPVQNFFTTYFSFYIITLDFPVYKIDVLLTSLKFHNITYLSGRSGQDIDVAPYLWICYVRGSNPDGCTLVIINQIIKVAVYII